MARKVFVSSDMSQDEKLVDVAETNQQAAMLWPWLLTAFDDWGRAKASPKRLKVSIFPMFDAITAEAIEQALQDFSTHGLLVLYEVDGQRYMAIPEDKWYKYQTHMNRTNRRPGKDKMRSDYPEPPQTPTGIHGEPRVPVPSPSPSPSPTKDADEDAGAHEPVDEMSAKEFESEVEFRMQQCMESTSYILKGKDYEALQQMLADGIDRQFILDGITESFKVFVPKHAYDKISTFRYCARRIYERWVAELSKQEVAVGAAGSRRSRQRNNGPPQEKVRDERYANFYALFPDT